MSLNFKPGIYRAGLLDVLEKDNIEIEYHFIFIKPFSSNRECQAVSYTRNPITLTNANKNKLSAHLKILYYSSRIDTYPSNKIPRMLTTITCVKQLLFKKHLFQSKTKKFILCRG